MSDLIDAARNAKAWPFEQARKLHKRLGGKLPAKGYVLFETGYGPSGLPHIGTFGEVARTTMVRRAFELLYDRPTKLICFSDDMDGLRKVPSNLPNQDALALDINLPLSKVRDPFGTHDSFAQHNNARLCAFLDQFGFDYEFASATDYYSAGRFDEMLLRALECYDKIMAVMLPTLGTERQATYSPFLPVSPKTGYVLQVPTLECNAAKGTIVYAEPDGEKVEIPVTGGHIKMQWKADWALRWAALGVDYEMSGKDLIDSVTQASKICSVLGQRPPQSFTYELFNDQDGKKISKSKGNGISMEEWLRYGTPESLQFYMYQKPSTAKRLYFDVIPKAVDEYHQHLRAYPDQDIAARLNSPAYHIHGDSVPTSNLAVSFSMLLNLASVSSAEDKETMWGFIHKYAPDANAQSHPDLDAAAGYAVAYYHDFVKPNKQYRAANKQEMAALADLARALRNPKIALDMIVQKNRAMGKDTLLDALDYINGEDLQAIVFAVGKNHGFDPLRDWFSAIYEVLLGTAQGPRFGGFIALYGVAETAALIDKALAGELV